MVGHLARCATTIAALAEASPACREFRQSLEIAFARADRLLCWYHRELPRVRPARDTIRRRGVSFGITQTDRMDSRHKEGSLH
jgi:hypothetical protein